MNKPTIHITTAILSVMLLAFTATALAQDPMDKPAKKGQHHRRDDQSMPVVDHMMRAVRHLDLSDEQKADIKGIMRELKTQERELKKEMRSGHEQLKALVQADTFDEGAAAALADKEGDLAAQRLLSATRAMSNVYAQLTDEQRAELETMAAERAARRAEHRKHRADADSELDT